MEFNLSKFIEEQNTINHKVEKVFEKFINMMAEATKNFNDTFRKRQINGHSKNMSLEDMLKKSIELQSREKTMKKGKKNKTIKNWEKNRFYQK